LGKQTRDVRRGKIDLPVGVSVFPREIYRAPRSWAEKNYSQLIYWNELPKGGHFAAFEQPVAFVRELRAVSRSFVLDAASDARAIVDMP